MIPPNDDDLGDPAESEESIDKLREHALILGLLLAHMGQRVVFRDRDFAALANYGICVHAHESGDPDLWVAHLVPIKDGTLSQFAFPTDPKDIN